jgi:SAM-dependent methyltransferase
MSERQYDRCFEASRVMLGSMCSQRWRDDPKTLLFTLSRYKQVARLLDGVDQVAEIGCGDGFAGKLVKEAVGALWLYDFDERFCEESGALQWDITQGPLPVRPYEAIYMLDVFEHIADSHAVLRNVCASLRADGRAIIGVPSLESQQYASEMSQLGHVACMSGSDLKRLMEQYFRCVLVLSMNDEVLHSGFFPMSHYLLAIGIGVR